MNPTLIFNIFLGMQPEEDMSLFIASLIIFLASVFGARYINEQGLKKISLEEKGHVVEAYAELSKYQLFFLVGIIGLYFLLIYLFPQQMKIILVLYFVSLILFMVILALLISRKLKSRNIPSVYIRAYTLSTIIRTAGILIAMALIFYNQPH